MTLDGYDAETMTKVLAALDSINPMNGIFTKFMDYEYENWSRRGGDVRELATILGLEIEIKP